MNERRHRTPKASERQKEELVKYFEDNPQALRTLNGADNRAKQRIWLELTHKLNVLDGALKNTIKWTKYWNDIIIYTKTRAKTFISGECRCDRAPTEIEQRLLILIGHMSLLKVWQQIWETNLQKSTTIEAVMMKDEVLDTTVEDQSRPSSTGDLDLSEYETVVVDPQDSSLTTIHIIPSSQLQIPKTPSSIKAERNAACFKETVQTVEVIDEKETNDSNETGSKNTDGFMDELSENVRTLANGFNSIGTALHNIASLLERYNSK